MTGDLFETRLDGSNSLVCRNVDCVQPTDFDQQESQSEDTSDQLTRVCVVSISVVGEAGEANLDGKEGVGLLLEGDVNSIPISDESPAGSIHLSEHGRGVELSWFLGRNLEREFEAGGEREHSSTVNRYFVDVLGERDDLSKTSIVNEDEFFLFHGLLQIRKGISDRSRQAYTRESTHCGLSIIGREKGLSSIIRPLSQANLSISVGKSRITPALT